MENNFISEHIKRMYPNWLQLSLVICSKYGLKEEAKDLLQEVICDFLSKSTEEIQMLVNKQEVNYKAIDCFIVYMINRYAMSTTAPYRQRYHKNHPAINRSIDINAIDIQEEKEPDNQLQTILDIIERLSISEEKRQIFKFHYLGNKTYKEWTGAGSIAKQSKICKLVTKLIQKKIKDIY